MLYKFLFIWRLFVCLFLRSTCLRAGDLTDRRLCYKWYKNHYETLVIIYTHSRLLFKTSHTNECGRELPRSELSLSRSLSLSLSLSLSMRRIFATHSTTTTTTLPRFSQKHFGEAPIHPPSKNKAATYPDEEKIHSIPKQIKHCSCSCSPCPSSSSAYCSSSSSSSSSSRIQEQPIDGFCTVIK